MSVARAVPIEDGRVAGGWPFALYALSGFAGLLAEQGFEKYVTLLTGATVSGAAVVIFSYFLGFAAGSGLAGALLERGAIRRPLRAYGTLELLVGVSCIGFAFGFHRTLEVLAPLQRQLVHPVAKFLARFVFGSILILPTATLMGASFPLIAHVVDRDDERSEEHTSELQSPCNLVCRLLLEKKSTSARAPSSRRSAQPAAARPCAHPPRAARADRCASPDDIEQAHGATPATSHSRNPTSAA